MTRAEIMVEAATWIEPRTRWVHQASCKSVGADCIGLVAGVYAACGSEDAQRFLRTAAWRNYGREPNPDFMYAVCDELMERIPLAQAMVADVLVFVSGRRPMHFGLVADGGDMIHSWLPARRVTRHRLDDVWRSRIARAYRPRGLQ